MMGAFGREVGDLVLRASEICHCGRPKRVYFRKADFDPMTGEPRVGATGALLCEKEAAEEWPGYRAVAE